MVQNCPSSNYYAFCDQDDFWFEDKLKRAVYKIKEIENDSPNHPILYSSNVVVADKDLNRIANMNSGEKFVDFAHVLIYNLSTGCTVVFNNAAHEELTKYDMDRNLVIMHDRLADLIISMFGTIIYDKEPSMLYRQHGNNVCGEQSLGRIKSFFKRVKRFLGPSNSIRSDRARMLLDLYGDLLSEEKIELLNMVGNYKTDKEQKKKFLKSKEFARNKTNDFLLRCLIRLKKI